MRLARGPSGTLLPAPEGSANSSDLAHLGYCTNIHPGETLPEVRHALEHHVCAVKAELGLEAPFGVGLRLSNTASLELAQRPALDELKAFLRERGLYVFTLNGFPYGAFHGTRVKEAVYEPDWRSEARLSYTNGLAELLAELLPEDLTGSISTVPGAFKRAVSGASELAVMSEHMLRHVALLHALREQSGRTLALALEPEPCCLLETIDESARFFETQLWSRAARARIAQLCRVGLAQAESILHRHLGLCLDACHAAVEFEDPVRLWETLARAEIEVKKVQISSGLRAGRLDAEALAALTSLRDEVYLHQSVLRNGAELVRYVDLPEALDALNALAPTLHAGAELRVHYHVPIFVAGYGVLESTRSFLLDLLEQLRTRAHGAALEVETYTWDVLPPELRTSDVTTAIASELRFALQALAGGSGPS